MGVASATNSKGNKTDSERNITDSERNETNSESNETTYKESMYNDSGNEIYDKVAEDTD